MSTALLIREVAGTESPFNAPKLIKTGTLTASSIAYRTLSCMIYYDSTTPPAYSATIWTSGDGTAMSQELSGGYWMLGIRFKSIHWTTSAPIRDVTYNCIYIRYDSLGWGAGPKLEHRLYYSIAAGGSDGENLTDFTTSLDTIYPIAIRYNSIISTPELSSFCPLSSDYAQWLSVDYEIYGFSA